MSKLFGMLLAGSPFRRCLDTISTVRSSFIFSANIANHSCIAACSTSINISMSFGGQTWPIDPKDMNFGPVDQTGKQCIGAIFDLSMGTNIVSGGGNPNWVIGDTFLVCSICSILVPRVEKFVRCM